uniref:Quinohemoprotein amine dehydrogenase alpha subunit haem binding domain-containing protein n=1 Tax=uncultured bacterium Ak20-3 TaxID=798570 RepID=D9MX74_9BACT|nr:hypothetical protein AKSOIL_0343 [uncultured bacterium Ak20-3]
MGFMPMLKRFSFVLLSILSQNSQAESDGIILPPGPNRELVIQNCIACHSERLIVQNHMSRKQWDEKITWMQEKQNLWPLASDTRRRILDYLEAKQSPSSSVQKTDAMDGLRPRCANPLLFVEKGGG